MIFVIAGNAVQPFHRLARLATDVAKITSDTVIFQNGSVHYEDCDEVEMVGTLDRQTFQKVIIESDFVITHCGAGTLRTLFQLEKRAIGIPRLNRYGEHVNDHQLQIARQFHTMQRAYLPDSWADKQLDVEKILKSFHEFRFSLVAGPGESLNEEIAKLLERYLP